MFYTGGWQKRREERPTDCLGVKDRGRALRVAIESQGFRQMTGYAFLRHLPATTDLMHLAAPRQYPRNREEIEIAAPGIGAPDV
jgi:hypothetical protein